MPIYFAFGSNLYPPQMAERCPGSRVLQPGVLKGYRLAFSGYSTRWEGGVATIVAEPFREVQGLLYDLTEEDQRNLDRFEGFPTVYDRLQVSVGGEGWKTPFRDDLPKTKFGHHPAFAQLFPPNLESLPLPSTGRGIPAPGGRGLPERNQMKNLAPGGEAVKLRLLFRRKWREMNPRKDYPKRFKAPEKLACRRSCRSHSTISLIRRIGVTLVKLGISPRKTGPAVFTPSS